MAAENALSMSTAFCALSMTSPSGWVILGVVGLVCVTVVAVTAVKEHGRTKRERKQN